MVPVPELMTVNQIRAAAQADHTLADLRIANLKLARHVVHAQPEAFSPWSPRPAIHRAPTEGRRRMLDRMRAAVRALPLLLS